MTGRVQVYTGEGKGKTTAALGLALRAAGAGMRVFIARFLKTPDSSELAALERLGGLVTVASYGREGFIFGAPEEEDIERAREGFREAREAALSGRYGMIVLDEVNVAVDLGMIAVDDLLDLIDSRPGEVELVLTGRNANERIVGRADLVTEMVERKHYYRVGVPARRGIET
jgi:cob(I)alamin adenosyltransferase